METKPLDPFAEPYFRPFLKGLRAFVARRVPERDADDVAQDVLLRLHQGLDGLRDPSRWEPWAFGIARRTIADYYRSRKPVDLPAGQDDVEALAEPDDDLARRGFGRYAGDHSVHEEVLGWLRPTAEQLPTKYRDALLLADFDGHKQKDVAERLGLSLSGAKSRVQRARGLLSDALRRCCEIAVDEGGEVVDFRRLGDDTGDTYESGCEADCSTTGC